MKEEASLEQLGRVSRKARPGRHDWLKRRLRAPSASWNKAAHLEQLLSNLDPFARVMDLGSGMRRLRAGAINLDIGPFPNVDVIGDGVRLPFPCNCFDVVVCQAVLEHVPDPQTVVAEIGRVLRPGGHVYVEVPFLQGFHADPHDYQRYTLGGVEHLMQSFKKEASGVCVGPSSALAWVLREYLALFVGKDRVRTFASHLFGWLTFWIKYLDVLLTRNPQTHVIASGLFFLGRKVKDL
jgi:SAM-dependent methyltransferase